MAQTFCLSKLFLAIGCYRCSHSPADIANKQVVLFSYGSGLASSMYMLRVASDCAPGSVLDRLMSTVSDVRERLDSRMKVEPAEFARIMKLREDTHHCGKTLFPVLYYFILQVNFFSSLLSFILMTVTESLLCFTGSWQEEYLACTDPTAAIPKGYTIQMMHGSEWTLKYDEPEVEMSHSGCVLLMIRGSVQLSQSLPEQTVRVGNLGMGVKTQNRTSNSN